MSVIDGQNANQTTFNNAFMSRTANDNTTGKKDLQNTDPASGADVINVQREINSLNAFSGRASGTAHDATPTWTNNDVGTSGDDLKERAEALTQAFDATVGHNHDGSAGSGGPLIEAASGVAGIVSNTTQDFSGQKTFEDGIVSEGISNLLAGIILGETTDSSSTGASANIGPYSVSLVRLTNASLTGVQNIDPGQSKFIILRNATGATITIVNNNFGTAANRIITGTGANITVANDAQIFLVYDSTAARWVVVGGTGSGTGGGWTVYATETISASGTVTTDIADLQQVRRVEGNAGAVIASTTPFGALSWVDGTIVRLVGQHPDRTVTFTHNNISNGFYLNGDATLGQYDTLDVQWDDSSGYWIEIARSIK